MELLKGTEVLQVDKLMWNTTSLLDKTRNNVLGRYGLTYLQFEILEGIYHISKKEAEVIQIDLAERTKICPMTTSTILCNLQKRDLIERERGLVNTRTVEIKLTAQGKSVYFQAKKDLVEMKERVYKDIDLMKFTNQLFNLSEKLQK